MQVKNKKIFSFKHLFLKVCRISISSNSSKQRFDEKGGAISLGNRLLLKHNKLCFALSPFPRLFSKNTLRSFTRYFNFKIIISAPQAQTEKAKAFETEKPQTYIRQNSVLTKKEEKAPYAQKVGFNSKQTAFVLSSCRRFLRFPQNQAFAEFL